MEKIILQNNKIVNKSRLAMAIGDLKMYYLNVFFFISTSIADKYFNQYQNNEKLCRNTISTKLLYPVLNISLLYP
jgi:hypothetical protein